ncbi:hypothetical protein P280DRAFT_484537 [Massarina eburnea CBS 473.64]|uniref:Uncharacterized protein n=1 Tax=Massarina eburnea CBS 473.64 TaxID=1395130 RepID=A0A6A6RLV0_9PLEO|nr:hypothetical protein P280DRAFT_484537 [Massarina eburnea CBS 473.64]
MHAIYDDARTTFYEMKITRIFNGQLKLICHGATSMTPLGAFVVTSTLSEPFFDDLTLELDMEIDGLPTKWTKDRIGYMMSTEYNPSWHYKMGLFTGIGGHGHICEIGLEQFLSPATLHILLAPPWTSPGIQIVWSYKRDDGCDRPTAMEDLFEALMQWTEKHYYFRCNHAGLSDRDRKKRSEPVTYDVLGPWE